MMIMLFCSLLCVQFLRFHNLFCENTFFVAFKFKQLQWIQTTAFLSSVPRIFLTQFGDSLTIQQIFTSFLRISETTNILRFFVSQNSSLFCLKCSFYSNWIFLSYFPYKILLAPYKILLLIWVNTPSHWFKPGEEAHPNNTDKTKVINITPNKVTKTIASDWNCVIQYSTHFAWAIESKVA